MILEPFPKNDPECDAGNGWLCFDSPPCCSGLIYRGTMAPPSVDLKRLLQTFKWTIALEILSAK
jgi:hypothetical protein